MRRAALVVLLALGCASTPAPTPAPVHAEIAWSSWSAESFARAAAEDRLILINVIADWCHWCHVMDEVTYRDPAVAALLAQHFVVLRVDSDARPDIAERYRAWGWPAIAFLSPQAEPVLNVRGYRNPEVFAALLRELIDEHARGQLRQFDDGERGDGPNDADLERVRSKAIAQLDGYFDTDGLGWGSRQKYPWPNPIDYALLRARLRSEDAIWQDRALATLAAERQLIDPVWGGMYQYSLKGVWTAPHYEKIAMIQAGAIETFAHAAMVTGDPAWLDAADDVTRYLSDFMQAPAGGFYASQDADLRKGDGSSVAGPEFFALDDAGRRALGIPRVDTNVYADLNGLIIHALVELYRTNRDPLILDAAARAADRVLQTHADADGGLRHAGASDDPLRYLADQAAMGWALLNLHRVTGESRWLDAAVVRASYLVDHMQAESGGLYAHTKDPQAVGVFAERRVPLPENALAAQFFIELHMLLDGDGSVATPWLEHARRALLAVGSDAQIEGNGKVVARYLIALELLLGTKFDLTLVAAPGDPAAAQLEQAALRLFEPRASFERSAPGQRYPGLDAAAVYLCSDVACSRPLQDPATLAAEAERFLLDR